MQRKRFKQILALLSLSSRGYITATEFAKRFSVSTVTSKKWLERARAQGLLDCTYHEYRNVPTANGVLITTRYYMTDKGAKWLELHM